MTDYNTLKQTVKTAIWEAQTENPEQVFSIYKTARKLGKDPKTIKRMIGTGTLKATSDQKHVSQREICRYLNEHPTEPVKVPTTTLKPEPHKKLVHIPEGYSAIIVENNQVDTLIEATQAADQAEAVDHYFKIFETAKIIKH